MCATDYPFSSIEFTWVAKIMINFTCGLRSLNRVLFSSTSSCHVLTSFNCTSVSSIAAFHFATVSATIVSSTRTHTTINLHHISLFYQQSQRTMSSSKFYPADRLKGQKQSVWSVLLFLKMKELCLSLLIETVMIDGIFSS